MLTPWPTIAATVGPVGSAGPAGSPLYLGTQSLLLDGVDEYVDCGDIMDNDGATAMSWSAWVKTSNHPAGRSLIVAKTADGNATTPGWQILQITTGDTAAIRLAMRSAGGDLSVETTAKPMTENVWQHVVVTWDGVNAAGVSIYVDGSSEALTTIASGDPSTSGGAANAQSMRIGARGNGSYLPGNVRDVAVWDGTELSAVQAGEVYNSGVLHDLSIYSAPPSVWYECGASGDDATHSTGTIQDLIGTSDGTPTNTEAADIEADVP